MVRKTKNQMYEPETIEAYNDEDFYGEGVHIHGGALAGNEIRGLLDASYDKTVKNVDGGWVKDEDLSTGKSKVFYNPDTGKSSVVHRGTVGTISDWKNNAVYALGGKQAYKDTSRYKHAKEVQRAAESKYGNDNIITLGHSQGGLQAELLGKKGNETITLNKATRPFSNAPGKNQTDIRTTTDLVSAMNPFSKAKNTESISLKGFNPLKAHATTSLKKLGNKMIGKGIESDSDSDSDSSSSSDEEIKPKKRGRPKKGGAILGKMKKAVKYVKSKDGLATDLIYKGIPSTLGTLAGVAGGYTGGPAGAMAGQYAGEMAGKLIAQKVGRETKMGSDNQRGVGTKRKSSNKTVKNYFTDKKGGLASDLLHHGVPVLVGGLGGAAGSVLSGPMGAMAGSQMGYQVADLATDKLGKKIGVGLKKRGRPKKQDVNIDIDINSHNADEKSKTVNGGKLKKGSPEMAEKMARLRALRKKK